ncbi:hypothetical protein [uncultured Lactobacillus sp.]|uniref:hypothetical protein n=1 Tax=uncultured Lactobacillus sp. TaxID=153152 RepID=UPI0026393311|nr:hypothetical protein [uncultured Lactobacillus sp.]
MLHSVSTCQTAGDGMGKVLIKIGAALFFIVILYYIKIYQALPVSSLSILCTGHDVSNFGIGELLFKLFK